ncbi:MAG: bifunctional adenosylcobinamide kinase/adenosylcobinamide-phosphate guanylyltransferase [Porticoccaceae bacterium]|nr:MAG: bifunctional adenosylcobinamide kinase/adenosylcobinamide-phosphate guanylyltransferase [Porticoccaceae bacterium]
MYKFHELILGGVRSGKSLLAEQRAEATGLDLLYLATATAGDAEMSERIRHHQARRQEKWALLEEPTELAKALSQYARVDRCILVDCLTLWLSNCLHENCWELQSDALLTGLPNLQGQIIFVSNETGMGVVPMGELSRQFVDKSGFFHQQLASLCDQVTLTVAGLPLSLKTPTQEE